MTTKELVLKDTLKRVLILWQLYKCALQDLRTSDTLKELANNAKAKKDKDFVDFRVLAIENLNALSSFMIKLKKSMPSATFNAIMTTLTSEQVKEIDLLLDEVTKLPEEVIEQVTARVSEAKSEGVYS